MWECLGRQDRSWFGARDVLGYFALRWPPGASPQGGAPTPNPRGKEAQKSAHCLPPGWHQLLLTDTERTDFQKGGVPKYGVFPTAGPSTEIALPFHLPSPNHKLLCCRRRTLESQQEERPGASGPWHPNNSSLTLRVKPLWLVSFGHKPILSSIT